MPTYTVNSVPGYSSITGPTRAKKAHRVEGGCQVHAQAGSPSGKWQAGWATEPARKGSKEKSLALKEIELQFLCCPQHCL